MRETDREREGGSSQGVVCYCFIISLKGKHVLKEEIRTIWKVNNLIYILKNYLYQILFNQMMKQTFCIEHNQS